MQGSTLANRFAYKWHPVGGVGMGAGGEVQAQALSTLAKYFVLGGYWSSGELFGSPSCCQTSWIWAGSRGLFTRQHEIQLLQNSLQGEGGHCWDLGGDGLASRFCRSVWKLIGRSFLSHDHDLMTNPMNGCMINSTADLKTHPMTHKRSHDRTMSIWMTKPIDDTMVDTKADPMIDSTIDRHCDVFL